MTISIWHGEVDLTRADEVAAATLSGVLGIELVELGPDWLSGRMPVDPRTRQPAGVLHGGASVAFAETLASWAGTFVVDRERLSCAGVEINANHLRPVASGWVTGVARPLSLGRRLHVWEVRISDERERLVCVSRCTLAVLESPAGAGPAPRVDGAPAS